MKTIRIKVGEEYQVKIAEYPDREDFFYPAYEQAANELVEIIRDTESFHEKLSDNGRNKDKEIISALDYSNNIIAFDGDRGQGKSSAMLSFSKFLEHSERTRVFFEDDDASEKKKNTVSSASYLILQRIDPTKIEKSENVLTIILAKLFHRFIESWEETEYSQQEKGDILKLFENCYNEIEAIKSSDHKTEAYPLSNLEKLKRIGDSESLKNDFFKLIQRILQRHFHETTQDLKKLFVVIQLDDTDLNTARAHEIVEDVRKYLMLPNVIILMAADIEQLTYAIEQTYIKHLETIDNAYKSTQVSPVKHHRMAVKYIDKLIPGKRDIHLPVIQAASRETPDMNTIEYIDSNNKNILKATDRNEQEIKDIQELILRFIYRKTGLIFIKPTNYLHYIIPRTMRGLVNFLSILNDMEDVELETESNILTESSEQLKTRLHNLELFETYFISNWIPSHVDIEYISIVHSFIETPWTIKNKQLIREIRNRLLSTRMESWRRIADDNSFLFRETLTKPADMVALASVRDFLSKLENFYPNQAVFKLTFAVRTLYSINASKIICGNLIEEKDKSYKNMQALFQFYGGDIFGAEVNEFVRKAYLSKENEDYKKRLADRADFTISYSGNNNSFKKKMQKPSFATLISFFCVFEFPRAIISDNYSTPFQLERNNTFSSNIHFNISYPFLYLYQPRIALDKATAQDADLQDYDLTQDRLTCINILSSLDLMNKMEKDMKSDPNKGPKKKAPRFSDHISDFFERVEAVLKEIAYLPLTPSLAGLQKMISDNAEALNSLYEEYKSENLQSFNSISTPKTIRETATFELLKQRISDQRRVFLINQSYYKVDLASQLEALDKLSELIHGKTGEMTQADRDEYQSVYNKATRAAQNKLKEKKDEN